MNKKILIIIGIILVLGVALYFMFNKSDSSDQASNNFKANESRTVGSKSLKDILLGGKTMKCEFKDGNTESVFYMANQNVRGDVLVKMNDKTIKSHTIIKDKVSYTWEDGAKTGFKVTASENDFKDTSAPASSEKSEAVNLDKPMDYNCSDWSKDNSYFELPTGVEFTDLNSMLPAVNQTTPTTNQANGSSASDNLKNMQCAACASAPAESQVQCRAALGCK